MKLENNFTVPAGIDATWQAFNDPETVAPCFPGATLQSFEGDSFTGTVKVKLGPISLTYQGKGTFVERDEANHRIVIDAQGRDSRGNGTAGAVVTGTLTPQGESETAVKMVTDMTITGRPAQFGRGMIADVSDRIVGQFSAALAERLAAGTAGEPAAASPAGSSTPPTPRPAPSARPSPTASPAPTPRPAPTAAPAPGSVPAARASAAPTPVADPAAATAPASSAASTNGTFRPLSSDIEAIDLLDTAGAPLLKRLIPVATGLLAVLLVLGLRRRRSRHAKR
ncbi:MAG: carbon monoxide dehydrogenase [Pseudonocardia sp.]|nr:carbon monoxide dehydrogenase [Pseudonocardia sp.]